MREVAFLRRNAEKWERFEMLLKHDDPDPDELADLYVQVTDDLSYARTYYPDSKTTRYLNDLSNEVHQRIYRTKPEDRGRLVRFWTEEVPRAVAGARTEMATSLAVFLLAIAIGMVSAAYEPTFVRLILGDAYVNMTLENIEQGDPMAVYKSMNQMDMFLSIAINNVRVAILAFGAGLLFSVGTGYVLLTNGIMIGAFQYFFIARDLAVESMLVIYIHGTLELSAIVIAGAAGFVLGNGFLFPGTYTRRASFVRAARQGGKILVGLIPVFVIAALLEGFVTRYTNMPPALSLLIIGASAAFVLWYFVLVPLRVDQRDAAAPRASDAASREGPPAEAAFETARSADAPDGDDPLGDENGHTAPHPRPSTAEESPPAGRASSARPVRRSVRR
jgi:uncharacterized membrane protein SpoIIM required for sporulation